jgi:hypothetical protein
MAMSKITADTFNFIGRVFTCQAGLCELVFKTLSPEVPMYVIKRIAEDALLFRAFATVPGTHTYNEDIAQAARTASQSIVAHIAPLGLYGVFTPINFGLMIAKVQKLALNVDIASDDEKISFEGPNSTVRITVIAEVAAVPKTEEPTSVRIYHTPADLVEMLSRF